MKKLLLVLSIIATVFIIAFFVAQDSVAEHNEDYIPMPYHLQTMFGIGLLIISFCIFAFFILILFKKMDVPDFLQGILFEFFIVAVLLGIVSFFLLFKQ